MDDDDLFSVFADKGADAAKRKQPEGAASGVASVATAGGVAVALESDSKAAAGRATDEEAGAAGGEDDAEDDEDGTERAVKKPKRAADLCPAAGPGSCVIHDITPQNQAEGRKACRHHVSVPPGLDIDVVSQPPPAHTPAKEYKFELDPFQRAAVNCLEKNQSVLVSAHTSAGKTAVAEYAIAMALRDKQRVVYTSPIKALSNQKFRELTDEFTDVGLMTGDVTINPEASLLVMTTEILRSMLYRGSELMREVVWIIYDEIHYMRDRERGVVWEESIVLVPSKIRFVFLSATIPNAPDFASWVARVHAQPCNVVYTDYRPTPLQHYMFPAGGDGLHLVVDENGEFREDNFHKALAKLESSAANNELAARAKGKGGANSKGAKERGGSDIYKIVKLIMDKNFDPVIVFSFSKKDVESLALQMSKLDFNTDVEKDNVEMIFNSAIDQLSADDKKLPAVEGVLPLLKKGIGIHHGGLLPILKEVIEILFQEGLIKCLIATETFSMGLNMPAKTCVFTAVRKWDGENFRWVSSGEYIQMSGRAGRRGLDDKGITILMMDEKMEPDVAKNMVKGQSDALNSSFHLSYNMLLNLLRFEGADPEYLIQRSFYQFQCDKQTPGWEDEVKQLEAERKDLVIPNEDAVASYHSLVTQHQDYLDHMRGYMTRPKACVPFLNPGRLLEVYADDTKGAVWGWGVLLSFKKSTRADARTAKDDVDLNVDMYLCDVLLPCAASKSVTTASGQQIAVGEATFQPPREGEKIEFQAVQVPHELLKELSSVRIHIPQDVRSGEARRSVGKTIGVVHTRFPDGLPLLDPVEDMGIKDTEFLKLVRKAEKVEAQLASQSLHRDKQQRESVYPLYKRKLAIDNEIGVLKKSIKGASGMVFRQELKSMKRVLRRLKYTDADDVVSLKGRAACGIDSGDELVICELIFDGVFKELSPEVCAAVLSCFVFDEKTDDDTGSHLVEELKRPIEILKAKARRVATVQQESKVEVDVEEYVKKFKLGLADITLRWCRGTKFVDLMAKSQIFEGSVIRYRHTARSLGRAARTHAWRMCDAHTI